MYDFVNSFIDWVQKGTGPRGEIIPLTDAPKVYLKYVALQMLSAAVGRKYYINYGARDLFSNLWLILIGRSSFFRKSTSIALGMKILEKVNKNCKFPNEFSMEELIAELDEKAQGIFVIDEFSSFYAQFGRTYMQGGVSILTELYDRYSTFERRTRSGEFTIINPFISIFSATTLESLENELKSRDLRNGFLARFHFVIAREKELHIEIPGESNRKDEDTLVEYLREIGKKNSMKLKLSDSANSSYKKYYAKILEVYKSELKNGLSAFITRLLTSTLKFSILFHLSSKEEANKEEISKESMERATECSDELIKNVIRLFGDMAFTPYQERRRKILETITVNNRKTEDKDFEGIDRSRLMRKLRLSSAQLDEAIKSLREEGVIDIVDFRSPGAQKRTAVYFLTDEFKKEEGIDT